MEGNRSRVVNDTYSLLKGVEKMAITKSDLEFMEEAKKAFLEDEELATYRDENGTYIALRTSSNKCRDSITILETVFIEEFEGFLPEGKPLGIKD
jgi:hypothetical protein